MTIHDKEKTNTQPEEKKSAKPEEVIYPHPRSKWSPPVEDGDDDDDLFNDMPV